MANDLLKLQRVPREMARWQRAQQELLEETNGHGLKNYRDLIQRFPGVPQLWFELGMAAAGELDFDLAGKAFRRAQELAPNDAPMLVLLAQQHHRLRQIDEARACFEKAVTVDPASVHAQLSLAAWREREGKLDAAWQCVEACLARNPSNPQVNCVRALLLHRQGSNAEAEPLLRGIVNGPSTDPNVRRASRRLLGVVLDELGQYPEAFRWLGEAKAVARQTADTEKFLRDYDRADARRRELLGALTGETLRRWKAQTPATSHSFQLALLGGHPRSGTTLLEQVLGAHPEILAIDESEAFAHEIWHALAPMNAAGPLTLEALDGLTAARRSELAARYFKSLLRGTNGQPAARVVLDKNPSPTAALHLWLRVFSNSKIIIALRDPRDVIISCFFQNLMLTPTNANFLSLERAAKHYSDLMDVWLRLRELGGFDWIETRYEDMVANLETEGRRVTEFAGLAWHPNQSRPHETARQKILFAPTYSEAAQPVHSRAVGRWRRYAEMLGPVQDSLAPYCRALGYEA